VTARRLFSSRAAPEAPIARSGAAGNVCSSPAVPEAPTARSGTAANSTQPPDKRLIELIRRFAAHEDPVIAEAARWTLARLKV